MDEIIAELEEALARALRGKDVVLLHPDMQVRAEPYRRIAGRDPTTGALIHVSRFGIRSRRVRPRPEREDDDDIAPQMPDVLPVKSLETARKLVEEVARKVGTKPEVAAKTIDAFLGGAFERSDERPNEEIPLGRLGTVSLHVKQGRVGRNPQTGHPIPIPGRASRTFSPSRWLEARVNDEPFELSPEADRMLGEIVQRYAEPLDDDALIAAFERVGVARGGLSESALSAIEGACRRSLPPVLRRLHAELALDTVGDVRFLREPSEFDGGDLDEEDDIEVGDIREIPVASMFDAHVPWEREQGRDFVGHLEVREWLTLVPLAAELRRLPGAPSPAAYAPLARRFVALPLFELPF